MHTLSSLVIALAWTFLSLSDWMPLDQVTGGLGVVAGLVVVILGFWMLRRWRRAAGHGHGNGNGHGHGHGEPDRPGLWLLGISGGLVPSPAAFLLLVTGIFSGRSGFALLLVVTFGVGMAVVLFGVGLVAVWGKTFMLRGFASRGWLHRASRVGPLVAAVGVTVAGCAITANAVVRLAGA